MQNVFTGEKAYKAYLNPDNHPPLPLVELPSSINRHRVRGVRIMLKLMHFLPLGNVKSLPAYNMLEQAQQRGELAGVSHLVESSSGNTVLSLAVLARAFGVPRTLALASNQVERGKLQLLRFLGTDVRIVEEDICPDPNDPRSGVNTAKRMGADTDWINPGQYHNADNPAAHRRWTGPQIWSQTEGGVTLFVAGLGTTGTLVGTGSYLKEHNPTIRTLGVVREPNNPVPGVRTQTLLNEIAFDWQSAADVVVVVGTRDAYAMSLDVSRLGILVGPSSGFPLAGLMKYLDSVSDNDLDALRNKEGDVLAVVIAPDSPLPYIDEYVRYLREDSFPPIENEHLLPGAPTPMTALNGGEQVREETSISPSRVLGEVYRKSYESLERVIGNGEDVSLRDSWALFDMRTKGEYEDHHLLGSERVEYDDIATHLPVFASAFTRNSLTPVFVCMYGAKSSAIAQRLRACGVQAYSLDGGTLEWSRLGLPRVRNAGCLKK